MDNLIHNAFAYTILSLFTGKKEKPQHFRAVVFCLWAKVAACVALCSILAIGVV
jgi:hypothetical protein